MMLPDDADTSTTIADIMKVKTSSSSTGSQPSTRPGKVIKKRPACTWSKAKKPNKAKKVMPTNAHLKYIQQFKIDFDLPVTSLTVTCQRPMPPSYDFIEVFSPPRIAPHVRSMGGVAGKSYDLHTGYDLLHVPTVVDILKEANLYDPRVVMLSPPCTFASKMQDTNWAKMSKESKEKLVRVGLTLLTAALAIMRSQEQRGRYWIFEHPRLAKTWKLQQVMDVVGDKFVDFDQCMLCLKDKESGQLHKKPTRIASNLPLVLDRFRNKLCDHSHSHERLQGSNESGNRCVQAARYPPMMCGLIAGCVMDSR